MRRLILCLSLAVVACSPNSDVDRSKHSITAKEVARPEGEIAQAIGAGLQGDARRAVEILKAVDGSNLSQRERDYRSCMLERFGETAPSAAGIPKTDSFAGQIVATYIDYWHQALRDPDRRRELTLDLESALRKIMRLPDEADSLQIEPAIQARLNDEGLNGLLGQTGVLRELMIWRREDRRSVSVEMPHGTYETDVAFLDDFLISGWGRYATCETRGAGGWVADRTLFAVVPSYQDLDGEEFRVTFLGHETQHFLDLDNYPGMASWELEYRAKLMELAMADETQSRVLRKFIEDQGDDPASPHSFANKKILAALMAEFSVASLESLQSVPGQAMRETAYSLFQADTALRDR